MNNEAVINLVGAIINRAILDLDSRNLADRKSARDFLAEGGGLDNWCKLAGLSAEYIRKEIKRLKVTDKSGQ
jgi:hypothetical protein